MQAQNVETVSIAAEVAESATVLETNFGDEQPVVIVPYRRRLSGARADRQRRRSPRDFTDREQRA
ncbi:MULTISPECIES: hypothetical protein [unclassified Burkholderia]|uniref:hypothetical protein n=1 Tax=unclassified Burkholderia TaxID=2613784 RepID=UPI0021AB79C1|nr:MULTISPECIES: hypothetical protein [unclassified Burkholderia]